MKTEELKIYAHLNPNEGGCDYSNYFVEQCINNQRLHPAFKAIPIHRISNKDIEPMIMLYDGEKELLKQCQSQINIAKLQQFTLDYLNIKTR